MKIKHFGGYGSVNAKKTLKKKGDLTVATIVVSGNHELGLGYRYSDTESVTRWLAPKLHIPITNERQIVDLQIHDDYVKDANGEKIRDSYGNWVDERTYTVTYAPSVEIAYNYM